MLLTEDSVPQELHLVLNIGMILMCMFSNLNTCMKRLD